MRKFILILIFFTSLILGLGFFYIYFSNTGLEDVAENGKVLGESEANKDINLENILKDVPKNVNDIVKQTAQDVKKITTQKISEYNIDGVLPFNSNEEEKPIRIPNTEDYKINSTAGIAMDTNSKKFLFSQEVEVVLPIASLTKLMTALVFLDNNPGWEVIYEVKEEDKRNGGIIYIFPGEKITIENLFNLSLVASANTATICLVHSTGLTEAEFIAKMNEKAKELKLNNTIFFDPIGLNNSNVSTAEEVAYFAERALNFKHIRQATLISKYEFTTIAGRKVTVNNTDYLLDIFPQNGITLIGGKTGYTEAARYCFVGRFIDSLGNEIISVILGSPDINSRFEETKNLVNWVYNSYEW
ncbi:MAG: serine hydrolase [Patescibacteria group bacterium]